MCDCMKREVPVEMSNERSIQILKPFRDMMVDQHGCPISDVVYALDKAIEALQMRLDYLRQTEITLESAIDYLHGMGWLQDHDKIITEKSYEQGHIQGRVEMRTELLKRLKKIVGSEVWTNI